MNRAEGGESGPVTPLEAVHAWMAAWERLDADAVAALFSADATYVSAWYGELDRLPRRFALAARRWTRCRIEVLALSAVEDGALALAWGRYRFGGTERGGAERRYEAHFTFGLARQGRGGWRLTRLHESLAAGATGQTGEDPGPGGAGTPEALGR